MSALAVRLDGQAPIEVRDGERLSLLFAPVRSAPPVMVAIVLGSMLVHAIVVATAIVGARAPVAPPREIAVEIVQEAPTPPKPLPHAAEVPPRPAPMKAAAMPPAAAAPKPAPQPAAAKPDLKNELARLRAEEAALKSELAASTAASKAPAPSGKAVALAAAGDGDGDPIGYQQIVFSQLAKAKDGDGFHGAVGTTGVRFEIAETGALAHAEVAMSSGDAALDREALDIVRRAAPFPPPPKDAERSVFANVNFVAPRRP